MKAGPFLVMGSSISKNILGKEETRGRRGARSNIFSKGRKKRNRTILYGMKKKGAYFREITKGKQSQVLRGGVTNKNSDI